jgi:hypothetical protein
LIQVVKVQVRNFTESENNPSKYQPTMPHCCGFCGKEFPTRGGVKRHIASRPECRRQWELMIEEKEDFAAYDLGTHGSVI